MIVAVNGSVTPSVTRLRCVLRGSAAAACATWRLAVASCCELDAIAVRCDAVRFSADPSSSNVFAVPDSAGASARSAWPCCFWKRAACSSGSFDDRFGFFRFCVSRTGLVTMSSSAWF